LVFFVLIVFDFIYKLVEKYYLQFSEVGGLV
jgi:hypothetical protein